MERPFKTLLIAASCLYPCASALVLAETVDPHWALCGSAIDIPPRPTFEAMEGDAEDAAYITADEVELIDDGPWSFWGNVEMTRGPQQLSGDTVVYDQNEETAEAEGNVQYWDEGLVISAERGRVELDDDTGEFEGVSYHLLDRHAHGDAAHVFVDEDEQFAEFKNVDYTTCLPEDNDWQLSAKYLKLDFESERGTAKHVILKVKNTPVFYLPYINFPISDRRKTGFLAPSFGNTNNSGIEVRTPFYWNISPAMDATFAPRGMSKRGVMLMGEYRYLLERGNGQINADYLPSDNEFRNKDRHQIAFTHNQSFLDRGELFLTYNDVSDDQYFSDFGNSLSLSSERFLERRADISYRGDRWNVLGRVQNFQTVDPTIAPDDRPYERLPQFLLNVPTQNRNRKLNLDFTGEAVNFDRTLSVDGGRFDLYPSVNYPRRTIATFLEPKVSFRFTQYALDRTQNFDMTQTFTDSPNRAIPYVSLDSGVFFERDVRLGGTNFLQTLEPRLYYLYVPFQSQNDLPVFDSGNFTFEFDQLFRQDRFTGADRVGDANQLSLAVTTRFLHGPSGEQMTQLSLGQLFFFEDRKVQLPGVAPETDFLSPFVADLQTKLPWDLSARGDLQWNPNNNVFEKGAIHFAYDPDDSRIVNVAYRLRKSSDVEQTDVNGVWPVSANWNFVGRWLYSLQDDRTLEVFGGVEYNTCCWGFRAIARRFLADVNGDFQTGFFIQVELKGLAGLGKKTTTFLKENIPGYHDEF